MLSYDEMRLSTSVSICMYLLVEPSGVFFLESYLVPRVQSQSQRVRERATLR